MPETLTTSQTRQCVDCGESFPFTSDYFVSTGHIGSNGLPRLRPRCGINGHNCYSQWEARRRAERRTGVQAARTTSARRSRCNSRKFGVEIEFIGNRDEVTAQMTARGLNCATQRYNHRVQSCWKVITDSSIGSGGGELVSPILSGENGRDQVRKACEALQAAGATVNTNCGLHIHHNARDLPAQALARLAIAYRAQQTTIDGFLAPSRRSTAANTYCRGVSESLVNQVARLCAEPNANGTANRNRFGQIDRYFALNFASYSQYGSVEVRQHQGTTNAQKIIAWLDFGQAMIEWAQTDRDVSETLSTTALLAALMNHGSMPADSARYMAARAVHYINNNRAA